MVGRPVGAEAVREVDAELAGSGGGRRVAWGRRDVGGGAVFCPCGVLARPMGLVGPHLGPPGPVGGGRRRRVLGASAGCGRVQVVGTLLLGA